MTIYYRAPGVRITHDVIEVLYPSRRRFRIRELRNVYGVRIGRGRQRRYQVCAIWRRRRVRLFETADVRAFGQVSRALLRAIEQCRDSSSAWWDGGTT